MKEIKRIRMRREGDVHFCRKLKGIGLMGCVGGDINFIKQSYSNRMRICTRRVNYRAWISNGLFNGYSYKAFGSL